MERRNHDALDLAILKAIQENGRIRTTELAGLTGLAVSAVHERLKKLFESGLIERVAGRLNASALGFGLRAFISLSVREPLNDAPIAEQLARIPAVQEVHDLAGQHDFLVKVIARDMAHLHAILRGEIAAIGGIAGVSTAIVMRTIKETADLPL